MPFSSYACQVLTKNPLSFQFEALDSLCELPHIEPDFLVVVEVCFHRRI